VLLIEYDAKGALGLIVNRPTKVQLGDLLPGIEEFKERADIVYVGGPVSKNQVIVLMRSVQQPREAGRVFADTYVSSSMETLKEAVSMSLEGGSFHTFVGYAGWGPGQLDDEVSRGDWHVSPGEEAIVFDRASEEIWPELIELNSGQWVRDARPRLLVTSRYP
jgi:putative transcriptional regulator